MKTVGLLLVEIAFITAGTSICFCGPTQTFNIEEYHDGKKLAADLNKFVGIPDMDPSSEKTSIQSKEDVLVFWDCDDVLQKNIDPTLQGKRIWEFLKGIDKAYWSIAIWQSPKSIVEPSILDLTRHLKQFSIPQFVFTQCTSDPEIRYRREQILAKLGYSFSNIEIDYEEIKPDCALIPKPGQAAVTPPIYDNGIVYSGSAPKGKTLKGFLNSLETLKKVCNRKNLKIAFIDDNIDNLKEVSKACQECGIKEYKGFHYTVANLQLNSTNPPDEAIIEIQKHGVRNGAFYKYEDITRFKQCFPRMTSSFFKKYSFGL